MLKAQFWTTSVARVELDQRARDARLQEHDRRLDAAPRLLGEQIADAYLTRFAARSGREAKRDIYSRAQWRIRRVCRRPYKNTHHVQQEYF